MSPLIFINMSDLYVGISLSHMSDLFVIGLSLSDGWVWCGNFICKKMSGHKRVGDMEGILRYFWSSKNLNSGIYSYS
jgi:hypothetical protein